MRKFPKAKVTNNKGKTGNMISQDWRIFDVGGARSLVRYAFSRFIIALEH